MPRTWVWTLVLPLCLIRGAFAEAGWDARSQAASREEQAEEDAIIQDLDVLSELEMLQLLDMLQEMEILSEIDPGLPPGSEKGGGAR